jgi:hypothetical protein
MTSNPYSLCMFIDARQGGQTGTSTAREVDDVYRVAAAQEYRVVAITAVRRRLPYATGAAASMNQQKRVDPRVYRPKLSIAYICREPS